MLSLRRIIPRPLLVLVTVILIIVTYDVSIFHDVERKAVTYYASKQAKTGVYEYIFEAFSRADLNLTQSEKDGAVEYLDKSNLKGSNTRYNLLQRAKIPHEMKTALEDSHNKMMSQIPTVSRILPFHAQTRGIVLVGGGRFTWLSYLAIMSIRKTGCTLPVELLLPTFEDYQQEAELCNVLPAHNASCIVLPELLGPKVTSQWEDRIGGYQLKAMAILLSSFQHVLLLDSDNIVIQNPEEIFDHKIYKENGMITWPDYWPRAVSPVYYEIAKISVDDNIRPRFNRFPLIQTEVDPSYSAKHDPDVPFHDLEGAIPDISTESGQLFMDKGSHSCTLLLSVYYNLLGPSLYYRLFSLGDLGEGDKDTFAAGAVACNEKLYQVASYISTFGYFEEGEFRGVGMGQKNPIVDYEAVQKFVVEPIKEKQLNIKEQMDFIDERKAEYFDKPSSALFTIHANFPKLDPVQLMDKESLFDKKSTKLMYKMYSGYTYKDPIVKDVTVDLELDQWKTINQVLCEEKVQFHYFQDKNITQICQLSGNQVSWLSEDN